MNPNLFVRLKKLAKKEGKVVFTDEEDAFVILPLDEYEMLIGDICGEECECESKNFGEDIEDDKELIRKVNEDIAKWREEQKRHNDDDHNNDKKKAEAAVDLNDAAGKTEVKEDLLTEEERYYLEPLE